MRKDVRSSADKSGGNCQTPRRWKKEKVKTTCGNARRQTSNSCPRGLVTFNPGPPTALVLLPARDLWREAADPETAVRCRTRQPRQGKSAVPLSRCIRTYPPSPGRRQRQRGNFQVLPQQRPQSAELTVTNNVRRNARQGREKGSKGRAGTWDATLSGAPMNAGE